MPSRFNSLYGDSKMKCTVLIPTYNRPAYLKRILSYYHQYGKNLPVLIADSSLDENKWLNRETVSSFHDASFSYLDKYEPSTNAYHKMLDALEQVSTEYCVLCADDDFVTPSGITAAVAFLDINPDFSIAHGHYLGFRLDIGSGSDPEFRWLMQYRYQSITHTEPKDRLSHYLSNCFVPTMYAVCRTNFKKMIFAEVIRSTSDYEFSELLHELLVFIYGKMKYLDILYAARDNTSGHTVTNSMLDFVKGSSYEKKYLIFSGTLANHLSKQSGIVIPESQKIVDAAISVYFDKYVWRKNTSTHNIITVGSIIVKIAQKVDQLNLPQWLYSGLRRLYRSYRYLFQSPVENAYDSFVYSFDAPSSKYYHDFNQIRFHVLSFAREKQLIE